MSLTAGVIAVIGDGTYSATPALGPFGVPATATSMAQALFEARFPAILAQIPSDQRARVVDPSTTPPTTSKGQVMANIAAQANADAAAIVGYVTAHAKAHVTTEQLGVMPSSTAAGTPIDPPASPVDVPIT